MVDVRKKVEEITPEITQMRVHIHENGYSLGILSSAEGYHYIEPALARNARQLH